MYKVLTANLHLQSEPVPSKDSTSCRRLTKQVSVLEQKTTTTQQRTRGSSETQIEDDAKLTQTS